MKRRCDLIKKSRKSYSRSQFEGHSMPKLLNCKRSQAELITSVLLILIGIAAVVLVSAFIMNLVKNNLQGTDCFQTTGQLEIRTDSGQTFFNSTSKNMSLSIKRGAKEFNLTGIKVVLGDAKTSKSYTIDSSLPEKGAYNTYTIQTDLTSVSTIDIYPIIYPKRTCEEGKISANI